MSDKSSAKGRHKPYLLWDAAADFRGLWRSRTSKTNFKTEAKHTSNHSRKCRTNDQNFCSSSSSNFNKPFKYFLPEKISIKNFEKYRIWALRWFSPSTCYDMGNSDSDVPSVRSPMSPKNLSLHVNDLLAGREVSYFNCNITKNNKL